MLKISIIPENIEFDIDYPENILSAGLKQNLNLPHGCKNGKCGACKCKVESGEIDLEEYSKDVLTEEEINQGYTLLCKAHAKTDIVLHIPHFLHGFPIKILPARVEKVNKINTTAIITLKIPTSQQFGFFAGQYIDIMLKGKNRSYSIASSPAKSDELELHVRYYNKGVFSEFVWNELKEQQILRFKGPLGNFRLQETTNPIILICTGTGFAPIKSIIESILAANIQKEIYLYWGNRTEEDFYLLELLTIWKEQLKLKITLCISQTKSKNYLHGYVTTALSKDFTDLNNYEIYACGNIKMIEDAYELAVNKLNLAKKNFFSDAFIPSIE